MTDADADTFIGSFDPSKTITENIKRRALIMKSVPEVEHELLKLPRASAVFWRDIESFGLVHPPIGRVNRICAFAGSRGLELYGCY